MNDPKYPLTEQTIRDLAHRYSYHAPHSDQASRYVEIRNAVGDLALVLARNAPASRELSTALTHLDAVMFNANAAIARNEKKEGGA